MRVTPRTVITVITETNMSKTAAIRTTAIKTTAIRITVIKISAVRAIAAFRSPAVTTTKTRIPVSSAHPDLRVPSVPKDLPETRARKGRRGLPAPSAP